MIFGNNYWDKSILSDLTLRTFNNQDLYIFSDYKSNMYEVLLESASRFPEKICIVDGKEYSFRQLLKYTDNLAAFLYKKYRIGRENEIGLLMQNSVEFIVTFLAVQKLGAVLVPFPSKYKEPEICSLVEKSNCKLLITEPKFYHWVRKYEATKCPVLVCEERPEGEYRFGSLQEQDVDVEMKGRIEDPALIIFTSGTTSNSKGVLIRNYNIQHAVSTYSRLLELNENDSTILAIPIYNITGLIGTVSLFLKVRGKIYIHKRFDARNLLEDMIKYQITFLHASPTVFTLMLNERRNFKAIPSLKKLACGSSNMPAEKILELKDWMPQMSFHTIYGLTETTSPGTVFPGDASSSKFIGSSGLPIPGLYLKIVNDQNEDVGFNKIGEICLKGTNVITEYYQIETDLVTEDKWLKTGDIGYINEAGYLYILDRKKDLINRGGEKIHSIDVENAIYQIDAINEVAVVGVEDSLYGEVPVAVISLKEGFRIDETFIRNFLKNKLASFEIPVKYYFVDELYKTENGKIDKKRIRQHLAMKEESINHES